MIEKYIRLPHGVRRLDRDWVLGRLILNCCL